MYAASRSSLDVGLDGRVACEGDGPGEMCGKFGAWAFRPAGVSEGVSEHG